MVADAQSRLQERLADPKTAAALNDVLDRLDVFAFLLDSIDGFLSRGEVMADVLGAEDKAADARAMRDLGVDWIILHTGFDERRHVEGVSPLDDLDAVVGAVDLPVQAVGGLSIDQALETVTRGARSVVIGAPLAIQADRFATGDEFEEILRDVVRRLGDTILNSGL